MSAWRNLTLVVVAGVLLAAAGGCQKKEPPSPYTTAFGGGNGREVYAVAEGPVTIRPQDDYLSVKLPGHLVIIEKNTVKVDAEERGKFATNASRFEVVFTNKTLIIRADGRDVLNTPLATPDAPAPK